MVDLFIRSFDRVPTICRSHHLRRDRHRRAHRTAARRLCRGVGGQREPTQTR
jgi:hypothetical protein